MFRSPPRDMPSPKGLTVGPGDVPVLVVLRDGWLRIDRPLFAIGGWSQGWERDQNAGAS